MLSSIASRKCWEEWKARVSGDGKRRDEFELIAELFAPLTEGAPGALNLSDDAAFLNVSSGCELVITTDTLIAGVHFFENDPPDTVARKALRVNLSDLAAKGARPIGFTHALALNPSIDDSYLEHYAAGLTADVNEFKVPLLGGDTTTGPGPLTITITALGEVEIGKRLLRSGAGQGDGLYVTGTIGDAALGLAFQNAALQAEGIDTNALIQRYRLPTPRLREGQALLNIATACLDISDGLVADVSHLCKVSGISAVIERELIPLSLQARAAIKQDPYQWERVLAGGDDYELAFTVPTARVPELMHYAQKLQCQFTRIGVMTESNAGSDVTVLADGAALALSRRGYLHR